MDFWHDYPPHFVDDQYITSGGVSVPLTEPTLLFLDLPVDCASAFEGGAR